MSQVTPRVRALVRDRDGMWCPGMHVDGRRQSTELHHRRTRGAGGTKDLAANKASNLVYLCAHCHQQVTDMHDRSLSEWLGLYVRQGVDPRTVPIMWRRQWSLLGDDGSVTPTSPPD